ncbi:MAG: orotidine-5'-phosphate decarboxylase [Methanomassiliicoccaceae archaeon]|nr:orotidine-5'-phosphate decarboxylase [Methanomassiliicoccaceae archaeon]MCL2145884.1 orotidine-5'-phosphate decarboxylase [Methanomassiliicoccaceae archaeon]
MKRDTGLILALDETDAVKAMRIAAAVSDKVDAIKINWPLILSAGPDVITQLSEVSDVICDLKVADIPNTVRLIVEGAVSRGASGVIVHAFTGEDSLREAVSAAGDAEIFAVTEMSHPGGGTFTAKHAEEMAEMGVRCGVAGFIAPATRPDRIRAIRSIAGDLKILSPGVGAQGGSALSAISAGADYVIVGRTIYGADDPASVASSLADEIRPFV